jgi:hypothetical protein
MEAQRARQKIFIKGFNARQKEVDDLLSLIGRMGEALEGAQGVRTHNEDGTPILWNETTCTDMECGCKQSKWVANARAVLKEFKERK